MQSRINENIFEVLLVIGKMLGMSRSVAVVFAVLYSRESPSTIEDIASLTNLSRSAVSLALRDLLQYGAMREVAVRGERCRYYSGQPDLARVVKVMMFNRIQFPLGELRTRLDEIPASHMRVEQVRDILDTIDYMVATIQMTGEYQ